MSACIKSLPLPLSMLTLSTPSSLLFLSSLLTFLPHFLLRLSHTFPHGELSPFRQSDFDPLREKLRLHLFLYRCQHSSTRRSSSLTRRHHWSSQPNFTASSAWPSSFLPFTRYRPHITSQSGMFLHTAPSHSKLSPSPHLRHCKKDSSFFPVIPSTNSSYSLTEKCGSLSLMCRPANIATVSFCLTLLCKDNRAISLPSKSEPNAAGSSYTQPRHKIISDGRQHYKERQSSVWRVGTPSSTHLVKVCMG